MHQIKILTSELKKFLELSSHVKTEESELFPLLSYIKLSIDFGECTLIKMNQKSFIKHKFITKESDIEFLVNIKKLEAIVNITNKDVITFIVENKKITIKDGYYTQSFGIEHGIDSFLSLPEINTNYTRIEKDILDSLNQAKVSLGKDILFPYFMYVYFDGNYVYSSSSQAIYIKKFPRELPKIAITFEECSLLSLFSYIDYSISGNHNTYLFGDTLYGFLQPTDASGFQFMSFIDKVTRKDYVKIQKQDMINFCTSTKNFSGGLFCNSFLNVSDKKATIKYEDRDKNEENMIVVDIISSGKDFVFGFNPIIWIDVLKSLPYTELCLSDEQGAIGIWNENDSNYVGLISKIQIK